LIGIAILARGWGSVFTAGLTVASIVYGPMLGAFLLGLLPVRATATGVMAGMTIAALSMAMIWWTTPLAWTWYVVVGTLICVVVGYAASRVSPSDVRERVVEGAPHGTHLVE